jgi:hypothetical protein
MGNGCTTFAALCMFDKRVGCTLFILETWRMHTHTNTHTHTHTHTYIHALTHTHEHRKACLSQNVGTHACIIKRWVCMHARLHFCMLIHLTKKTLTTRTHSHCLDSRFGKIGAVYSPPPVRVVETDLFAPEFSERTQPYETVRLGSMVGAVRNVLGIQQVCGWVWS